MMRDLGRALAAAVLAAFGGAIALALFYGRSPALHVDFDVTPPRGIVDGVYASELDPGTGRTFAWTGETLTIDLADIDRQVDWRLGVRVRGARAGGAPNPDLLFYVDGVLVLTHATSVDYEDVQVSIPARPAQQGLALSMRSSSTFVPGPSDKRALGVMLDELTLAPNRIVLPPRPALTGVALASAALGAAVALLGVTPATAVGTALLLSAALAALVARGFGPYTDFADVVARTTLWTGAVTTVLAVGVARLRGEPYRNTAKFAIAVTAAAFLLELLVLLHPDMPIGDTLFHAHRFQDVLGGRYFFTSVAPGNYQFPYAPGLYIFAIPFAGLVRRGVADMTVLRTIVCAPTRSQGSCSTAWPRACAVTVWPERSRSPCTTSSRSASGSWWPATRRMPSPSRYQSPHSRSSPRLPFAGSTGPPWVALRSYSRRRSSRTRARLRSGRSPRSSSRSFSGGAAGPRYGRRRSRCYSPRSPRSSSRWLSTMRTSSRPIAPS